MKMKFHSETGPGGPGGLGGLGQFLFMTFMSKHFVRVTIGNNPDHPDHPDQRRTTQALFSALSSGDTRWFRLVWKRPNNHRSWGQKQETPAISDTYGSRQRANRPILDPFGPKRARHINGGQS